MIRILIADDHRVFRQSLSRLLRERSDFSVVAEAGDCRDIIELAGAHEIDVALVDLSLPHCHGAESVMAVRNAQPAARVLVLTMHDREPYISLALRAGAHGYATKALSMTELEHAIRLVYSGSRYVCPTAVENLATHLSEPPDGERPHHQLSAREFKIFEMLLRGMRGREIASELALSEKTVSAHKMNLFRKMNLSHRSDLIHYAIRHNLI